MNTAQAMKQTSGVQKIALHEVLGLKQRRTTSGRGIARSTKQEGTTRTCVTRKPVPRVPTSARDHKKMRGQAPSQKMARRAWIMEQGRGGRRCGGTFPGKIEEALGATGRMAGARMELVRDICNCG